MKKLVILFSSVILFSCQNQKEFTKRNLTAKSKSNLNKIENSIINDFLDIELKKERYKRYKDYEIVIIEEALKKIKSIDTYLYSFDEWNSMNKINKSEDVKNMYFLDTIQINTIKSKILNEEIYQWKESDFNNIKMSLLKYNLFREKINSKKPMFEKEGFVIFLSKPLIIDNNNALISFDFLNCNYLCNGINHSTILMRKVNNKWVENGYYEDGVFN